MTSAYAVVTGDINNFTRLGDEYRKQLVTQTEHLLNSMVADRQDAQMFRGDSYQFITRDIGEVLTNCIRLICWFKMNSDSRLPGKNGPGSLKMKLGTRLSIGIGEIAYRGKTVLDSDGEAFRLSGRVYDEMNKTEIIRLTTTDEQKNGIYDIIFTYINLLLKQWTASQAETIFCLLSMHKATQEQVARKLHMTQPGVAKSLQSARWKEVAKGITFIAADLKKQYLKDGL